MKKLLLSILCAVAVMPSLWAQKTEVSIVGDQFYINGRPTYEGRYWEGKKIEGLLMNSRMVNGIFDDVNPETRHYFKYEDTGVWDADRNTREFVEAMEDWYSHGVISFDLNLQGGSPMGYGNKGWINSAFDPDGAFREDYKARLKTVLDRADELGMVVMLGYFYFGVDQYLTSEHAVKRAVREATQWVLDEGYRNVIIEVANECDIYYDHEILKHTGIWELVEMVKGMEKDGRRLLVSTSFSGSFLPTEKVVAASDCVLLHCNGITDPARMRKFLKDVRSIKTYSGQPLVVNEDDHYDYDNEESNFAIAVDNYVSWGYFDFRREGESFDEGYQSIPANWGISSDRKRDFFNKVKEVTGFTTAPDTYKNPILPGYHPDPSICRVGEDYYMVNSSFEWFPAIPIYHSRDLVNWELINYGVTNPEKLELAEGLRSNGGIYACTIRHHEGVFYIITTNVGGNGNFYVTTTDPRAEWSAPVELHSAGIDPSLMWDEDGKCYYVGNGRLKKEQDWQFQNGAWLQELDVEAGKLVGERKQLTYGHASNATWGEGPHLYKINGKYLLTISEGGTYFNHAVTQFHSDNVWGPYVPNEINPVLSHRHLGQDYPIQSTGHSDIVETQNGEWWMVALGNRKFDGWNYLARETFLVPMEFQMNDNIEGIVVNPGKGRILLEDRRPNLPWTPVPEKPARDEFNGSELELDWNMLRTPHEKWYSLSEGVLTLQTRAGRPCDLTNPSLLAKRIGDVKFTATTSFNFNTRKDNEEAGIILYRNDRSFMAVVKRGSEIVAYTHIDGEVEVLGTAPCPKGDVIVRLDSDGKDVALMYGTDENNMKSFAKTAPLWIIAVRTGGEFNGPMVGMYTTSNGEKSKSTAKFNWFEYVD